MFRLFKEWNELGYSDELMEKIFSRQRRANPGPVSDAQEVFKQFKVRSSFQNWSIQSEFLTRRVFLTMFSLIFAMSVS